MSRFLHRLGGAAARHPWRVIGVWLLAAAVVITAASSFGEELDDSFEVPGLDSQVAADLFEAAGSDVAGLTAQLVVTPEDGGSFRNAPASRVALGTVEDEAASLDSVVGVSETTDALSSDPAAAAQRGLISPDGRVAVVQLQYPLIEDLDHADLDDLKALAERLDDDPDVRVEARGELFFALEEGDTGTGELIGLMAAVVILLVAFGSLIAMGLPIATALFGLAIGVSSMGLINLLVDIPAWAPESASMVGIGVGIDYALFVITRHREHLARGMTVPESAGRAVATAGQAVIFAGGSVVIAILGMAVTGIPFMTAAGIAISTVVAIMVIASVTLLPALLGLAGHRINGLTARRRTASPVGGRHVSERWQRWGRHVASHAWRYAIGVTVLLVGLTAPVLDLRLGFPDDGSHAEHRTERQAYDLISDGFGPGVNGPLAIAVDLNGDTSVVEPLAAAIQADDGVASTAPANVDAEADVATIIAFPTTSPQDEATLDTVKRLRADVFPPVLAESPATAHVGGQTANIGDMGDRVTDRMFLFIGAVVTRAFALLMLVFRSILVPLKAAFLNLLSIGAAYGVLVMVFQWGWGKGLIGLETTVPIVPFIPMFMFAVLFGLSMDYEVFLLSRVREDYLDTRDNDGSVVSGIASTARVIASAALIMISVFLGFVLGDDPIIKMLGLGLATAIFVDATIVRLVLVPATMKLMGDANWWMPRWLDRALPTIDIEGEAGLPEPEYETDPGSTSPGRPSAQREPASV